MDRSILVAVGAVAGPWILGSLAFAYGSVLVTQFLLTVLRLLIPAIFLIGGMLLFAELGMKPVAAVLLLFGAAYLLYAVAELMISVLIRGGFAGHLAYRLGGGFGGANAVSTRDYSCILVQVGTGSLLAASTYSNIDWQPAELPVSDAALVNVATGLPMQSNGSLIDVGGSPYGFDLNVGFGANTSDITFGNPLNH
jgi:hypothetical protein